MADRFCTIDDVKAAGPSDLAWTDRDAMITMLIEGATDKITEVTRRKWRRNSYTIYRDTPDIDRDVNTVGSVWRVWPDVLNIQSTPAPEVKLKADGKWDDVDPLEVDEEYQVDFDKGCFIFYWQRVRHVPRSMRIVYTAGYEQDGSDPELILVPAALKEAVALQAAFKFQRTCDQELGVSEKTRKGDKTVYNILPNGLIMDVQQLVAPYIRTLTGTT